MEVTTLQQQLADEKAALKELDRLINEQNGNYIERMADAAAELSDTRRQQMVQRALDGRRYLDFLREERSKRLSEVELIEAQIDVSVQFDHLEKSIGA